MATSSSNMNSVNESWNTFELPDSLEVKESVVCSGNPGIYRFRMLRFIIRSL